MCNNKTASLVSTAVKPNLHNSNLLNDSYAPYNLHTAVMLPTHTITTVTARCCDVFGSHHRKGLIY